jgi:hypothetical protein
MAKQQPDAIVTLYNMTTKDLDDKLLNVFQDCPYKGKRKECTFAEIRDMEIDERLNFLEKMDEDEKVTKWQKHSECFMNALAR